MAPKKSQALAKTMVVAALVLAITSVWNDSQIVDEIPHIGAGYSYIAKGDYRLNPEHPPLPKDLAGIALSFLSLNQSTFQTQYWIQDINGQWNFGRNFIYNSGNDAIKLIRVSKLPILLFFILCALLIYKWTAKLYGPGAALLAIFLFSFSPTIIAHSRFVTTDMPALFGTLLGIYFFVKFLENQGRKNFWLAVVTFGIAQLSKFSIFLLNPFFLVLALAYGVVHHGKNARLISKTFISTLLVIVLGYLLIVWPVYALHVRNYPPSLQKRDTIYHLGSYGNRLIADSVVWASDKPLLRPLAHYGLGVLMVTQRSVGGNTTYFLGEVKNTSWKKYFPIVYFIKEPLPFWILIFITVIYLGSHYIGPHRWKYLISHWIKNYFSEFTMILWLAVYWYSSIKANLNIGVRHLIPMYGFVYILLSGQILKLYQSLNTKIKTVFVIFLATILGWYLFENLNIYPYYLTYFNQTVGGPSKGHLYVVDSNLDWGQDLKRLADWVNKNNIQKINLDYFGWADPSYYLKDKFIWITSSRYRNVQDFLIENPQGGYLAVSASFYMGSREKPETSYAWLDSYKPIVVIGNSIFVWKF